MPPTTKSILSDPIWQGIAAILALAAIIIPIVSTITFAANRLIIAPTEQYKAWQMLDSSNLREGVLQISLNGVVIPPQELVTADYLIWNRSQNPIVPDDFFEKIVATPVKGVQVIAIERVKQPGAQYVGTKRSPPDWSKNPDGTFEFRSQLINPGEIIAYDFLLWIPGLEDVPVGDQQRIEFSGKIKNIETVAFRTQTEAFLSSDLSGPAALLTQGLAGLASILDGRQIALIFVSAALMLFVQLLLLQAARILPTLSIASVIAVYLAVFLSIVTSESIISSLLPNRMVLTNTQGAPSYILFLFLSLQVLYLGALGSFAYTRIRRERRVDRNRERSAAAPSRADDGSI